MAELEGRIALVTGATRGLGHAVSRALAAQGAHVVALGRTQGALEELDDAISAAGGAATLTPLDIRDDPALERLGAALNQRWGRLDLLVHCAAEAAPMAPAEHVAAADLDKAIAVDFRAVQRLIRVLHPLLKAAPAAQAVFVDDPDTAGAAFLGAYGAAKAAARTLALSYAAEQARRGPRIWLAAPPPMPTAVRARFRPGEDRATLAPTADVAERLVAKIVAGEAAPGETVRL
ncbi:MAG: SDR family NAD(P)-dependent oxidoreductase [Pikeienuella sp.]|uniref:SDR family NAD(P)-dependent oxidoreductase n=1 Tax=Pikeienuella sp. TaxID=2831957 RepID=UPI003918CB8F